MALVGTLVLIGGFVYLYKTTPIPDPNKDFQTQTSFVYYSDGKTELGSYATQNREIIPLTQMPHDLQNAVVAAEDRTFCTNSGIDPKGIVRAAFNDARGNATQGALDDHPAVRQDPLPDPGALRSAARSRRRSCR